MARACLLVNNLRTYLRTLRGRVIAGSLRVLQLRRRRGNALALQRTVRRPSWPAQQRHPAPRLTAPRLTALPRPRQLRRVDELRAVGASVRSLLERGAYQAALAAIESAQGVMKEELAGLRCIG